LIRIHGDNVFLIGYIWNIYGMQLIPDVCELCPCYRA